VADEGAGIRNLYWQRTSQDCTPRVAERLYTDHWTSEHWHSVNSGGWWNLTLLETEA